MYMLYKLIFCVDLSYILLLNNKHSSNIFGNKWISKAHIYRLSLLFRGIN